MRFHPSDMVLEEFYLSQAGEHQALLAHLVRCTRCSLHFQDVLERAKHATAAVGEATEMGAAGYEEILDRAESLLADRERAVAKERAAAPGLFVELMKHTPEQQRLLIRNSLRFRSWGLCELLLERCIETTGQQPAAAEELALLALEITAHLGSAYRAGLIQDMQARVWAYLGNTRRVRSDFSGAEVCFLKAGACLKQGTRDPVELAICLDLEASLRRAQRRFDEALRLLRRASAIFRRAGHAHRAGRCLVKMDSIHCYAGHPEWGIPLLYQAMELIEPDQEPRLELCVRHNLIDDLTETGRFLEARKLYRETRSLYRSFPDAVTQNRRRWVKGKISAGLGQTVQAERLLLASRDGFIAEDIPYDTALVSLELAILFSREGRTADLKRLAQEMLPIFSSLQIHREALAALTFLRKALDAEGASLELVSRVAKYLRRAKHDPGLRFEP